MAPRRAPGTRTAQELEESLHISSLPSDLLLLAFQHVALAERHRSLALVCRQWAELVNSPALLASLDVTVKAASGKQLLQRLSSLFSWLLRRAAGHVHQLRLAAECLAGWNNDARGAADKAQATACLNLLLIALGRSLRELSLRTVGLQLPRLGCLKWLEGLTSLELDSTGSDVVVDEPLSNLSALQWLRLRLIEGELEMRPTATLPPALTSLWVYGLSNPLPEQFGALSCLKELTFDETGVNSDEFGPLAQLHSSLTALRFNEPDFLPDCLGQLTALRSLTIHDSNSMVDEDAVELLYDALPQLQQLTAVHFVGYELPNAPHMLSTLRHLDTLCWSGEIADIDELPGGPWLGRLRRLAMPAGTLCHPESLAALSGARQLEQLGASGTYAVLMYRNGAQLCEETTYYDSEVLPIIEWAGRHASLRLLVLDSMSPEMAAAAAAAERQRPGLRVQVERNVFHAVCGYSRQC